MQYKLLLIILFISMLLTAINYTTAQDNDELAGTKWVLISMGGSEVNNFNHPKIHFQDDNVVEGNAGCNYYKGSYYVSNGSIEFEGIYRFLLGCSDSVNRMEDEYLGALRSPTEEYTLNDNHLIINYADGEQLIYIPSNCLTNTQWELISVDGVEVDRGLVNPIILEFGLRNQLRGYIGCNLVSGIYTFEDGTITIQSLSLVIPQQNCDSPYTPSQEMSYLHTLQTNSMYVAEEGNLRIIDNDGHVWIFGFSIFKSVPVVIATVEYFDTNYRLPHDAVIALRLEGLTDTNGSRVVISRQSIYADGMQLPLIFELPYVSEQVIDDHEYVVRVEISVNGELLFSTDEGYKVLTGSNPNTVHVEMHKMGA